METKPAQAAPDLTWLRTYYYLRFAVAAPYAAFGAFYLG